VEDLVVIERKILKEAYWREEFEATAEDISDLSLLTLEASRPLHVSELAKSLIDEYCQREEDLVRRQLSKGTVYRPNASFAEGETLVFPHLDFAIGTVVDQRDGHNPEFGDFKVVSVRMDGGKKAVTRHFAAELAVPHKLAFTGDLSLEQDLALSPTLLFDSYGDVVASRLDERLQEDPGFVSFNGVWLAADAMAEVHIGHLNIAEAMLEMHGEPMRPDALLVELDLPVEVPMAVQVFSLNVSMSHDERFDDVGDANEVIWGLRRWEPEAVVLPPARLSYDAVPYDRTVLDVTHLQLERELDDVASELIAPGTGPDASSVTVLLDYAHWYMGSLALTARTKVFFPEGSARQRTRVTFLDRAKPGQFPGWVVHEHRFVYGLEAWYRSNNIPVGGFVKLERTEDPRAIAVDYVPRRMQREWVRVAFRGEEGELEFRMQKSPLACEYDELCVMDLHDRDEIDELWLKAQDRSLRDLVQSVFLDLAKLNPSGLVHAKTLYNAVNIVRRCPPGPIFSVLFEWKEFVTTGDGYWMLQGAVGVD
jgi:hypothetical protein